MEDRSQFIKPQSIPQVDEQGVVIGIYDLAPFGEVIAATGVKSRKGFIDKEVDQETSTSNHGVRQYDAATGRFTSVDPLWERYPSQTPYHYCFNSPIGLLDGNGKNPLIAPVVAGVMEALGVGIGVGITVYIAVSIIEDMGDLRRYMQMPAVSTAVAMPIDYQSSVDVPLSNGGVFTINRADVQSEGAWFGVMIALLAADQTGDNPVEPVLPPKTLEDVLEGAVPGDESSTKKYNKGGGMKETTDDFNAIIIPGSAEAKKEGAVQVGKLPDGRRAVVRGSKEGSPTLEIQRAGDHKPVIKIRYRQNQPE